MKVLFVCLILTLYITNAYGFMIKPTCVDSDLCEKANREAKDVECWIRVSTDKFECSSPFDEDSDYNVKEYKFIGVKYIYIPKLRYSKYLSKEDVKTCEKQNYIVHQVDLDVYTNQSCDMFFYKLKKQKEQSKCEKAWAAWTELSTKGYITNEYPDVKFLEMIKKEFQEKLLYVNKFGFIFKFDELDQNIDCYPFMDDSPLCHSLFNRCNEDPKSHFSERFFIQCEDDGQKGQDIKEALNYMNDSPDYDSLSWEYRMPGFEFHSKYQKNIEDDKIQETKPISNNESCSPPPSGDLCGSETSKETILKEEEKPDPTLCKDSSSKCYESDFCDQKTSKPSSDEILQKNDYVCKRKQIDGYITETFLCHNTSNLDSEPVTMSNSTLYSWFGFFQSLAIVGLFFKMIFNVFDIFVIFLYKKFFNIEEPVIDQTNDETRVIDSYILINDILNQQTNDPCLSQEIKNK